MIVTVRETRGFWVMLLRGGTAFSAVLLSLRRPMWSHLPMAMMKFERLHPD